MEVSLDALALALLAVLIWLVVFNYAVLKEIHSELKGLRADADDLVSKLRVASGELQSINVQVADISERVNARTLLGSGFDASRG
jgi:hypothetical protein